MSTSDAVIAVGRAASLCPIAPVVPGAHARHMRIWLRRWRRLEVLKAFVHLDTSVRNPLDLRVCPPR